MVIEKHEDGTLEVWLRADQGGVLAEAHFLVKPGAKDYDVWMERYQAQEQGAD
jgi:hypothetical protein